MTNSDNLTPRQQRAAERILEDEGLAGSLSDEPASRLVGWASEEAIRAATDTASEGEMEARLADIRRAARQAARQASSGHDIVAIAQALLGQAASPQIGDSPPPTAEAVGEKATAPTPVSVFQRRIESLRVRLISLISHRTD